MCYNCQFLDLFGMLMPLSFTYLIYPMASGSKITAYFVIQVQKETSTKRQFHGSIHKIL